eukprot:403372829
MPASDDSFFKTGDPNVDPIQVTDVMKALPYGKFQKFMSVFYLYMFVTTAFLSFNFAFFLMPPIFRCPDGIDTNGNMLYKDCTRTEVCANLPAVGIKTLINTDHKYSLLNWIERFDLECGQKFEIGLFGSMFFLGYISSCLIFPPLADAYGRKKFAVGVCVQQALCFVALLYIHSQMVYYIAIFLIGFSVPLKAMIAYTHLMEFLPGRVSTVSGLVFFLDGMVLVVSPLILEYVSKNTDVLLYIPLFINISALIIFAVVYVPESIKYQLEKGKYDEARRNINYIYKFNKSVPGEQLICESFLDRYINKKKTNLEILLSKNQKVSQLSFMQKLTSERNLLHNLSMMIMSWVAGSFSFYLLNFLIKYMPGDIFFNSMVSGLSAIALLIEGKLQKYLDLKGGQIMSFVLSMIAAVCLTLFDPNTDQLILYALVLLLAKSGATLSFGFAYAIHLELFPSHFLVTSYGICNFFCRGLTMFAPLVAEVEDRRIPLGFLIGLAILGFISSSLLKKKAPSGTITI